MTYKARISYVTDMRVLFVCSGNAFRSPLAEALLKRLRPNVEVDSAGIHPVISIAESARKYLARIGAERHLKADSESLATKNLASYDLIVAMEDLHKHAVLSICPDCKEKVVVWNIEDPYFMPTGSAENIFNQIRQKVEELAGSV
jgi:protein-tyrosine-phosphatase